MRENYCVRSFMLIVLGAMEALSIGACTSRGIYEANQQDAHNACLNKPSGIERDKCLSRTSQTYDEYTREREKVQQDKE
ncbi:MAG TPA: hypothetical protein VNO35_22910 [Steroidobacteraceae bacterium]|nr:hypothetical protein [Steroidobacteraceae bacterium]